MVKIPKFLRPDGRTVAQRPPVRVDDVEEEGTAKDTARGRPSHKTRVYKKVGRRLAVMEEWIDFINSKHKGIY